MQYPCICRYQSYHRVDAPVLASPVMLGFSSHSNHSIKCSYHEDVVSEILSQLDKGANLATLDTRLSILRDQSTCWLWNAYQTVNNQALIKKVREYIHSIDYMLTTAINQAFENCSVCSWDLSYKTLTGVAAHTYLRELKQQILRSGVNLHQPILKKISLPKISHIVMCRLGLEARSRPWKSQPSPG